MFLILNDLQADGTWQVHLDGADTVRTETILPRALLLPSMWWESAIALENFHLLAVCELFFTRFALLLLRKSSLGEAI